MNSDELTEEVETLKKELKAVLERVQQLEDNQVLQCSECEAVRIPSDMEVVENPRKYHGMDEGTFCSTCFMGLWTEAKHGVPFERD